MADTKFKRGHSKKGGREKGTLNKCTEDIRNMVINALNDKRVGGEEDFIKWIVASKRNRETFYGWLMKMLPSNVSMEHSGAITFELSEKYMPENKDESE